MQRSIFPGTLTHDGRKASLEIPDNGTVAQIAWEELGGRINRPMRVLVVVMEDEPPKSPALNRFYRGPFLEAATRAANELGNEYTPRTLHDEVFAPAFAPLNDEGRHSTAGLGKRGFEEFYGKCERLAVSVFHLDMEQLKKRSGLFPEVEV